MNSAIVNMGVQISLQVHAFNSFGSIFRSRIAGSCGNSLNFLRNYHTVSHRAILVHIPIEISAFEPMKNGTSEPLKDDSKGKYGEEVC